MPTWPVAQARSAGPAWIASIRPGAFRRARTVQLLEGSRGCCRFCCNPLLCGHGHQPDACFNWGCWQADSRELLFGFGQPVDLLGPNPPRGPQPKHFVCARPPEAGALPKHAVTLNRFPLSRDSGLLLPFLSARRPQVLRADALAVAVDFAAAGLRRAAHLQPNSLRVGFNSLAAGASVNHLHFQFWRSPAERLPVEAAERVALRRYVPKGSSAVGSGGRHIVMAELLTVADSGVEAGREVSALNGWVYVDVEVSRTITAPSLPLACPLPAQLPSSCPAPFRRRAGCAKIAGLASWWLTLCFDSAG